MSIRDFFTRRKEFINVVLSKIIPSIFRCTDVVVCDTTELKYLITKWTENEGWKFNDFATFVELAELETPIELRELNKADLSFKCITALNTEVTISIRFGDWFDFCSELWITDGEETRRYRINSNYKKNRTKPEAILISRTITKQ